MALHTLAEDVAAIHDLQPELRMTALTGAFGEQAQTMANVVAHKLRRLRAVAFDGLPQATLAWPIRAPIGVACVGVPSASLTRRWFY